MGYPTLDEVIRILPKPKYQATLISDWQNTNDLIGAMAKSHAQNMVYAKKIAPLFRGNNARSTAKNVFDFIKEYIPYSVEPASKQQVKTLPRMFDDASKGNGSDCKMYAVLINTILNANKIPSQYRFVSFRGNQLTHTYAILPDENLIIDAVLPIFDSEKPFKQKKDMSLYSISGVNDDVITGIDFKKLGTKIKKSVSQAVKDIPKNAKKIVQGVKTVSLAVPRAGFLLLVSTNVRGLGTKLKKLRDDKKNDLKFWVDFGGNRTDLNRAINDGAKKKALLSGVIEEDASRKYLDMSSPDSTIGEPVTIASALASASVILAKVMPLLSKENLETTANALKTVNEANDKFKAVTGKNITDVVFKKDSNTTASKSTIGPGDLQPTNITDATAIAKKVAETQSGLNKTQIEVAMNKELDTTIPKNIVATSPKSGVDFSKYGVYILGAGALAYLLLKKK